MIGVPGKPASQRIPLRPRGPSAEPHSVLCWVRALLPGEEDMAWRAEVTSCFAKIPHTARRRRYLRNYRRWVPQLVWITCTTQLTALRRRELL
jgi:hypothetical protein